MPIAVACPNCRTAFNLADHLAGKVVRCTSCQDKVPVPKTSARKPSPRQSDPRDERILPRSRHEPRSRRDKDDPPVRSLHLYLAVALVLVVAGLALGGVVAFVTTEKEPPVGPLASVQPEPNPFVNLDKDRGGNVPPFKEPPAKEPPFKEPVFKDPPFKEPPAKDPLAQPELPRPANIGREEFVPGGPPGKDPTLKPVQMVARTLSVKTPVLDALPEPVAKETARAGPIFPCGTGRFATLSVPTLSFVPGTCWSASGSAFYLAERTGLVRRVSYPELNETTVLDTKATCTALGFSAAGVVVLLKDPNELWVLQPETLQVLDRMAVPLAASNLVTAPGLGFAILTADQADGDNILRVDLKTHQVSAFVGSPRLVFRQPAIHPNGRYLFAMGGFASIDRYRLDPEALVLEDSARWLGSNPQHLCLSPDGKRVSLTCGGGNGSKGYATYIYDTGNLRSPAFSLRTGAFPRQLAYDPVGGFIYAHNSGTTLLVFTSEGEWRASYVFGSKAQEPRTLTPHPEGGKLLMLTEDRIGVVEIGK